MGKGEKLDLWHKRKAAGLFVMNIKTAEKK